MITTSIFPGRYIQGDEALKELPDKVLRHGRNALLISCECCDAKISRFIDVFVRLSADLIISFGGGKTLDTAKTIGFADAP
ncbi:MAG: glycerol dehydrogenase [Alphaproteobacteria bacterium]|jgi:glycerol dehydrogenase